MADNTEKPKKKVIRKKASSKAEEVTVDDTKLQEAKQKVNDLLKGTGFEEANQTATEGEEVYVNPFDLIKHNKNAIPKEQVDSNNEWLKDQVDLLNKQVADMETKIINLRNENADLKRGSQQGQGIVSPNQLLELYREFEDVYMGRTGKYPSAYKQASFSNPSHQNGILDTFLRRFPFLMQYRNYNHWG